MTTVAVVYPFFAHYRKAVMSALLETDGFRFVLCADTKDFDGTIRQWEPPHQVFVRTPCKRFLGGAVWQRGVNAVALRHDVDAIVFLGDAKFVSTWLAAILARLSGKRVLFWTHGWIRKEAGVKRVFRNAFYKLAHGLLLYGNRAKLIGLMSGFFSENLYVIYNSLDTSEQKAIRNKIDHAMLLSVRREFIDRTSGALIMFSGRITAACKLDLLLYALAEMQKRGIRPSLLIVGDGVERSRLESLAKQLGLAATFYGECYDEYLLAQFIMASNVLVSPGKVGLLAMHALVYGTPVITHGSYDKQMPEVEVVRPALTGELFRYGDVSDLARMIEKRLLRPWPDPSTQAVCEELITAHYNPNYQRDVIIKAVCGQPAPIVDRDEERRLAATIEGN